MSYLGNLMAEQEQADALFDMGEAEWRDMMEDKDEKQEGAIQEGE